VNHDNDDLKSLLEIEKENSEKLITLAREKYKMDLDKIDEYFPKKMLSPKNRIKLEMKLLNDNYAINEAL